MEQNGQRTKKVRSHILIEGRDERGGIGRKGQRRYKMRREKGEGAITAHKKEGKTRAKGAYREGRGEVNGKVTGRDRKGKGKKG